VLVDTERFTASAVVRAIDDGHEELVRRYLLDYRDASDARAIISVLHQWYGCEITYNANTRQRARRRARRLDRSDAEWAQDFMRAVEQAEWTRLQQQVERDRLLARRRARRRGSSHGGRRRGAGRPRKRA
jgi:hypothetical protein